MELVEKPNGWVYSDAEIEVFFGNKNFFGPLTANNPEIRLTFLKQVHGDKIILQNNLAQAQEADAQFTDLKNLAMAIKTADCIPVLIFAKSSLGNKSHVMAIHAGWRGVASRIIPKGIKILIELGYLASDIKIWLGPHILTKSFEVKEDAINLLSNSGNASGCIHAVGDKTFFNLNQLALSQINEFKIPQSNLLALNEDTFLRLDLHSYRRDKDKAGRLISYIFKRT